MQLVEFPLSNEARTVINAIDALAPSVRAEVLAFLQFRAARSGGQLRFGGYKQGPAPTQVSQLGERVCPICGKSM
jgi:hypothetical protein